MIHPAKTELLNGFRHLLRPLVRIALRNGVAFGEFSEVLKRVYVEIAAKNFRVPGRKLSQSRIAIITGLTRKEVARMVSEVKNDSAVSPSDNSNRVSRVLVGWHTDPEFTGPYGLPLELPFDESRTPNFTELVRRYSGDMPARAMLDELLRTGVVQVIEHDLLKAVSRSYIPQQEQEGEGLKRIGNTIHNFIDTVDHNLQKRKAGEGRFERVAFSDDGLRQEDLKELDAFVRTKAQELLEIIDNWMSARQKPDVANGEVAVKTGVGVYHYIHLDEPPEVFHGESE
ncbi:DUF6502 family protein [soil metagenome]